MTDATPRDTDPSDVSRDTLVRTVRDEGRRVLAGLIRRLGDLALAEDAVQEAAVRALETWPRTGIPDQPRAWLAVTARRYAIDVLRRESSRGDREQQALAMIDSGTEDETVLRDDQLRLMFICCHPALAPEAQVALCLRTVCGFEVSEVARALLVSEPAMQRRLVRARQKIKQAQIAYRVPDDHELPARLRSVLATTYLIFTEGHQAGAGADLLRAALVEEGIRLARLLVALMPDEPSVINLLALMLLQSARSPARTAVDGSQILLADQDRSRWDHARTREAVVLLGRARRLSPEPEPYGVQAAIAACHNLAADDAATDWRAVLSWYDVLVRIADSPVVRLNRAVALAEVDGPLAGLTAVDALDDLSGYLWWHATRAELLIRLGRPDEAAAAYAAALALPASDPIRRHLEARLRTAGHLDDQ